MDIRYVERYILGVRTMGGCIMRGSIPLPPHIYFKEDIMEIAKAVVTTLDIGFMLIALASAVKDKDQSVYKVIAFFELLCTANIIMMWI